MEATTDKIIERVAYIALREDCGFNELAPVKQPEVPREIFDYNLMTASDKRKFLETCPDFFKTGVGSRHINGIFMSQETTRRNFRWLMEMRDIFSRRGDAAAVTKVNNRIAQFDVSAVFDPQEDVDWNA
jgi:hypothetical protein